MDGRVDLAATLRAHGHRLTRQRRAVWEALQLARGHLTVEELTAAVVTGGDDVDPASVYRTLALFEELGLARASRLGDSEAGRWEVAHPDEHFHLVCERCGEIDHHVGSLVGDLTDHLHRGHGFHVTGVELVVTGRCARCAGEPA
jgi:Fur family transcriptional regulator, ferric uptake regulator